jgi:hypothetical protein
MHVADMSLQWTYRNGYMPLISRVDLDGFHANDYMPNG